MSRVGTWRTKRLAYESRAMHNRAGPRIRADRARRTFWTVVRIQAFTLSG